MQKYTIFTNYQKKSLVFVIYFYKYLINNKEI